jgi:hypothetical protein
MLKSLLNLIVATLTCAGWAQPLVNESPLTQLVANDKLVARSVRVKSVKLDSPYTVNPIASVSSVEYEKFKWCQVEGSVIDKSGTEGSITLFMPVLVNARLGYPMDDRYYRPVKVGRWQKSESPTAPEGRFGMQLFYPKSSDIVEGSQLLVISEASNRVIPMAAMLLASRPTFNTREPMELFSHMIESLKLQSDWQARQVAYWIQAFPVSTWLARLHDFPSLRPSGDAHKKLAQLLSAATNSYRRTKICEIGFHLFEGQRITWKPGESKFADDFGPQYFIHKLNAIGLSDSYYDLELDPSIRIVFRSFPASDPYIPEHIRARSIKLLEKDVISLELQEFLTDQFHLMSKDRKYVIGSRIASFETPNHIADEIKRLLFPSQNETTLSSSQITVYEQMKKESPERGWLFLQEFCRWKLGRPTAEWFPRE